MMGISFLKIAYSVHHVTSKMFRKPLIYSYRVNLAKFLRHTSTYSACGKALRRNGRKEQNILRFIITLVVQYLAVPIPGTGAYISLRTHSEGDHALYAVLI
jgi:uncharacterized membrane protein